MLSGTNTGTNAGIGSKSAPIDIAMTMLPKPVAASMVAAATNTPESVRGTGTLDTVRYGSVLRARKPVGLRGAGTSYDGFYYVRKVKHVITPNEYTQEFAISREGTGALLPVVVP